MPIDVQRARAQTPGVAHRIHLNNCGASPMPTPVIQALDAHLKLEAQIGGYEAAEAAREQLEHAYDAVARLLGCSRDEIALVENATNGWCMAFYAFDFQPGDRILTAVSEYATNYIAYLHQAQKTGAVVEVVPNDEHGQLDINALEAMLDERVKLISLAHIPTNGGLVQPVAQIGQIAREHGIPFMLDACQSAGQLPLDVDELHVDILSATGRKFLRGPRGTGFLYVRKAWIKRLEPPMLDLWSAEWVAPDRYEIRDDARRFESWERFVAGQIGLGVAIDYALAWGLENIYARIQPLAALLRQRLREVPSVTVRDLGRTQCGIVTFNSSKVAAETIVQALQQRHINTRRTLASSTLLDAQRRNLGTLVRVGVHYFNTEEEIERLVAALTQILA